MWKFKIVDGKIVLDDKGLPIVIKPDGSEISYDINATTTTIANLQAESKTHREAKEAAERSLQAFAGIDPAAAKKAINDLKDVDLSKMVNAGKLDEVRTEVTKAFETKMAEKDAAFGKLQNNFHKTVKENIFTKSKFIADKLIVPPDMIMAVFGDKVEINDETGAAVFKGNNGQPLHSPDRPGELASADEAIAEWVKGYPNRDTIMKGANQSGSGGKGGSGGANGAAVYSRAEFSKLSAGDQMRVSQEISAGKAVVND
jgi:hypothetical protein